MNDLMEQLFREAREGYVHWHTAAIFVTVAFCVAFVIGRCS